MHVRESKEPTTAPVRDIFNVWGRKGKLTPTKRQRHIFHEAVDVSSKYMYMYLEEARMFEKQNQAISGNPPQKAHLSPDDMYV